jgi:hypothetical protein
MKLSHRISVILFVLSALMLGAGVMSAQDTGLARFGGAVTDNGQLQTQMARVCYVIETADGGVDSGCTELVFDGFFDATASAGTLVSLTVFDAAGGLISDCPRLAEKNLRPDTSHPNVVHCRF